jgi:toxin-antitoxin system PIN domain toxin
VTVLLDSNVLIALLVADHVHHSAAERWLAGTSGNFATCPITEGSLVRLLIREGQPAETAKALLSALAGDARHEFWPDVLSYREVPMTGVVGHRQVTDAYLAHVARVRPGRVATFDSGLAKLHPDVAELILAS